MNQTGREGWRSGLAPCGPLPLGELGVGWKRKGIPPGSSAHRRLRQPEAVALGPVLEGALAAFQNLADRPPDD
jgi:hypothetical protein